MFDSPVRLGVRLGQTRVKSEKSDRVTGSVDHWIQSITYILLLVIIDSIKLYNGGS